ncbi:hypothetical protein [Pseudoflavonifractor phocaeensis]|uniref:hypothetical protein n=1 Tax=Pseudoflavonifractor phocaeensis TaxID=1870988 RepID=UPI00195C871B|nr:hypothetical protein [Pseudoflavonifractor phocaeensis]MBM6724786.1 hypothetical protein [Pseudoflavonifractor phocaeensis]
MSKLKEADFYYGSVLSTLLNNKICPVLIEGGTDRQVYDFTTDHKDFRLFVKYRSAPTTKTQDYNSWQFVFSDSDIRELTEYLGLDLELSVGLVCGQDALNQSQYAVLHKEIIEKIFDEGKKSITISLKKGEKAFRISVGGGRDNAIRTKTNVLY